MHNLLAHPNNMVIKVNIKRNKLAYLERYFSQTIKKKKAVIRYVL